MTSVAGRSDASLRAELLHDVAWGLSRPQKELPPKYFYDRRGSELFDEITRLPEYYLTRTERALLDCWSTPLMVALRPRGLVELGAGNADKTRRLLDAMVYAGSGEVYVPIDVSAEFLDDAAARLREEYPTLGIEAVVGDIAEPIDLDPRLPRPMLIGFLGSTIGNFAPEERAQFLSEVAGSLAPDDSLLLGTDLVKDVGRLIAAYDDAAGVTAEFNRNVLRVLNRTLDANFDVDAFAHVARWDPAEEWIEMRLRADGAQKVVIDRLGMDVHFADGEELRTEISAKFRHQGVERELAAAGLRLTEWWTDPAGDFALSLSTPAL